MNATKTAATLTAVGVFSAAATGLSLATPSTEVTLDVDGHSEVVSTTAGTVGALLDSEHISHSAGTAVAPGLNAPLIRHQHIEVNHPWKITVKVDGKKHSAWTTADSVGAALHEMAIKVGPHDKVSVPLTSGHKNMTVVIKRGKVKQLDVKVALPKPVQQVSDASLTQGTTKLVQAGHDGVEQRVVKVAWLDGKFNSVKLVSRKVTVAPVTEVVAVGTKPVPAPPPAPAAPAAPATPAAPSGMSGAWAQVAQCETGGNPSIVAGQFYGMYMMTLDAWRIAGGSGLPSQASAAEQTMRAQNLYNQLGSKPWPVCGKYLP